MVNNRYKLYIQQTFEFAETMVIKSDAAAEVINDRVRLKSGDSAVDPNDKTSWKYYLNLAGKYHALDTPITIRSLDTLDLIEFNADNLKIHTTTAKEYQYGSRYYNELVSLYPASEQIILGALYPVDVQAAIAADDFSIIGYPSIYLESNEVTLINDINAWLATFKTRWFNIQYTMSDSLYITSTLAVMYQQLVPLLLTLRLKRCKTDEAHSYHIREYLASHGALDEFLDQMTQKQALFFYRNINYIQRNAGKVDTFNWLLQKVLTDRDIPVSEINLYKDEDILLQTFESENRFYRNAINTSSSIDTSAVAFYSLSELLNNEQNEAVGNQAYSSSNLDTIGDKLNRAKTSYIKTKVLESKMMDYTDSGFYSIQDIALNLWCYMSVSKQYTALINYLDTSSNQNLPIDNHIAFLYFLYAYAQVYSIPITTIPEFFVYRVAIDPVPTIDDLRKVIDTKYVSDDDLNYLLSLHTPLSTVISNSAFNDLINKTLVSYKAEHVFAYVQDHIYKKALLKNASYRLYKTQRVVSPYFGQTFEEVFASVGLPYTGLTAPEWSAIYKSIYNEATGLDVDLTQSVTAMQQAMVKLFMRLSSYSIQFLADINQTTIKSVNWSSLRLGSIDKVGTDLRHLQLPIFRLFDKISSAKDNIKLELSNLLENFYIFTSKLYSFFDVTSTAWSDKPVYKKVININTIRYDVDQSNTCQLAIPEGLPEFSPYFDLPLEEKKKVKDVYRKWVTDEDYIPQVDINNTQYIDRNVKTNYLFKPINNLFGFIYHKVSTTFDFRVLRDYTDLDAFYSNFGELGSYAFRPFVGFKKNNLGFKLVPGNVEMNSTSFKYVGGIRYNRGFGYSTNPDLDMELGDFSILLDPPLQVGSFNPVFDNRVVDFVYNKYYTGVQLDNYTFNNISGEVGAMTLLYDSRTIDVGTLIAGGEVLNFILNSNSNKPLEMNDFNYQSITIQLKDMILETGTFDVGSIQLVAGSEDLGSFSMKNFKQELSSFTIVVINQDLDGFKWTAKDIIALIADFAEVTEDLGKVIYDNVNKNIDFS